MNDPYKKHTTNGMVHERMNIKSGFSFTTIIATGIAGETTSLCIYDGRCRPESMDGQVREYIIPLSVEELEQLGEMIKKSINKRNKTLL